MFCIFAPRNAFPPGRVRIARLDETLHIVKTLWTEAQVTFEGQHYRVADARCEPGPVPVPPLVVSAFKPRMLRLAAKYAGGWNVSSTGPDTYRRLAGEFERACGGFPRLTTLELLPALNG